MGALNLRLPDTLEARLAEEAHRAGVARSEVARAAIIEFLDRKERARFLAAFIADARAGYRDPVLRKEALAIAAEALPLDNEALDLAERGTRAPAKDRGASAKRRAR